MENEGDEMTICNPKTGEKRYLGEGQNEVADVKIGEHEHILQAHDYCIICGKTKLAILNEEEK